MEEKNVFEDAEVTEEVGSAEDVQEEDNYEEAGWTPYISKESPKEKLERLGVKKEMDGKTLTVKEVFFTRPRTMNSDGTPIPAKETVDNKKKFYPGKLGVRFEEDNLVEYYPNFHYFVNEDGTVSKFAKINREGNNQVSKLFTLVVNKIGKPMDEVADQEAYDFLVGKKVKLKTEKGTYNGKKWFRNDIVEIL